MLGSAVDVRVENATVLDAVHFCHLCGEFDTTMTRILVLASLERETP